MEDVTIRKICLLLYSLVSLQRPGARSLLRNPYLDSSRNAFPLPQQWGEALCDDPNNGGGGD